MITAELLNQFAILLQRQSGLVFSGNNLADLQTGIQSTVGALGFSSP